MHRASNLLFLATAIAGFSWMAGNAAADQSEPPMLPGDRPAPKPVTTPGELKKPTTADQIAQAHMKDSWDKQPALECTLEISFTGHDTFRAAVLYDDALHAVRMKTDSATLIYDGNKCWVTPSAAEFAGARFHAQTWPFIVAAPFELDRQGVHVSDLGVVRLQDKPYRGAKVTFDKGMRDSADDWFMLYADPVTYQIRAMTYSIGHGGESHDSDRATAAITFENFGIFNGAVIATNWTFWDWSEETGIVGEPIGQGKLSKIDFTEASGDAFDRPADAREEKPAKKEDDNEKPTK